MFQQYLPTTRPAKRVLALSVFASVSLLAAGCSSSDDSQSASSDTGTINNDGTESGELSSRQAVFALKETGGVEPEYLIAQGDIMTGTLSTQGAGNEQLGWNFYYEVDDTIFVTGYENFATQSYTLDENGDLIELASFSFEQPLEMFGKTDGVFLASDAPRDGNHTLRRMYIVDSETGLVTEQVSYSIDDVDTGIPGEGSVGWPTAFVVREDALFVPFHKLDDSGAFSTVDPDSAYVAIYDWPLQEGASPRSIISDDRTSNIGVNGNAESLTLTEGGDMYSYSMGALSGGFDPVSTKPSGILKIPAGSEAFDPDYFLDIEAATDGGTLFWFNYLGDGKALGRVVISEDDAVFYSAYGKDLFNQKLVFIDLEAATVSDIEGVPLHQNRYSSPLDIEDGFAYVSVETAEDAYVYRIDAATGEATQGAQILGKTVKGFFFP